MPTSDNQRRCARLNCQVIFFVVDGALVYLDKPVNGTLAAFEDGFSALELSRKFYREAGLDVGKLDLRIR